MNPILEVGNIKWFIPLGCKDLGIGQFNSKAPLDEQFHFLEILFLLKQFFLFMLIITKLFTWIIF